MTLKIYVNIIICIHCAKNAFIVLLAEASIFLGLFDVSMNKKFKPNINLFHLLWAWSFTAMCLEFDFGSVVLENALNQA